jgi:hypothetical protein
MGFALLRSPLGRCALFQSFPSDTSKINVAIIHLVCNFCGEFLSEQVGPRGERLRRAVLYFTIFKLEITKKKINEQMQ